MKTCIQTPTMALASALALALGFAPAVRSQAEDSTQASPIEHEIAVQRAAEAAIWAMPAVSVWDIAVSTRRDLGGDIGDIVYFTEPMTSWTLDDVEKVQ